MSEEVPAKLIEKLTISGLPLGLHEGAILNFGKINYLFGSNGSGKSLTLKNIIQQAKTKLNSSPDLLKKGFFIQHIPVPKQDSFFSDQYQFVDNASGRELSGDLDPSVFYQELSDHPEILIRIRDSLQRYLGRHPSLVKRGVNNVMNFLREDDKDVSPYSPNQESDGLRRLSLLLAYIYHPKCLILGIDEPELHLHPDMVSFLLEELKEEIKYGKQFFLATHSPEVIQIGKFDDYAYFYFDLKDRLKESKIIDLNQVGAQAIMNDLGFLLDVYRRAFFFAPITLFVEGIIDEFVYYGLKVRGSVDWPRRIHMVNIGGWTNARKFIELWQKANKPFRLILDNTDKKDKGDKDNAEKIVCDLCNLFNITSIDPQEKINELKKHNVYIAPYEDVLKVKNSDNNYVFVGYEDLKNKWENFNLSEHISVLSEVLKVDEESAVRIREIESRWLSDILARITSQVSNTNNINESLLKVKAELEIDYPRLQLTINPDENSYMKGLYEINKNRQLIFIFAKDSAKHNYHAEKR